jgi:TonB family protein
MKRILLIVFLLYFASTSFAQNDSVEVAVDTINISGYVLDRFDKPLANVKINTEYASATTSKTGYFELKGAKNNSHISFYTDSLSDILFNNTSRFLIYHLAEPTVKLSSYPDKIAIEAKRENPKQLIKKKTIIFNGWPNYDRGGTYPGGAQKFYNFIKENLKYPEKAIANNIEGTVGIAFDITKTGHLANFKIIKDIGYDCADALIAVLKKSKKWNPGISGGKPTIRKLYIEIPFKLTD